VPPAPFSFLPAHPARFTLGALLALALSAVAAGADGDAAAKAARVHLVSPRLSAYIAAKLPRYDPARAGGAARLPADAAHPGVMRLPDYIVREPRLPDETEILTEHGRDLAAMNKYLGPSDGLDRGYLNAITLGDLWRKIPVLKMIPFIPFGSVSQEARARALYDEAEMREKLDDLRDIESLAARAQKKSAKPAPAH